MKLIVEMEMPKGCYFCPMSATYPTDWYCNAFDDSTSIDGCAPMKERPSWCPIKGELPDEHGDLVDRDEVKQKMIHYGFHAIDMTATEFCEDELQTVIAAEMKGDEHDIYNGLPRKIDRTRSARTTNGTSHTGRRIWTEQGRRKERTSNE